MLRYEFAGILTSPSCSCSSRKGSESLPQRLVSGRERLRLIGYKVSKIIVARDSYVLPLRGDLSAAAILKRTFRCKPDGSMYKKDGMTLIKRIVVIMIIAILGMIAVPRPMGTRRSPNSVRHAYH